MKTTTRIAVLLATGLASFTTARASAQDLLLGFNDAAASSSSAQNDYVIDLGYTGSGLVAAANANSGTINLSSTLTPSTFNSAFEANDSSWASHVAVGVVGSPNTSPVNYLYLTTTGAKPPTITPGQFDNASGSAAGPVTGEYSSASGTTAENGWTYNVATSPTQTGSDVSQTDVAAATGKNPLTLLSGGSASLTLWGISETTSGVHETVGSWVDEGTFNFNLNSDQITFTTSAVPEPTTTGILAGAGLLAVLLRQQLKRKAA
jgi:hypothetical protein